MEAFKFAHPTMMKEKKNMGSRKKKRKKKGLKKSEEEIKREKLGLITWIN